MTWDLDDLPMGTVDPLDAYRRRREREIAALPGNGHAAPEEPPPAVALLPAFPDNSVALSSISTDPAPPLLIERLDPLGHTILYGTGGVGKGVLACWWIVQLVRDGHRVLILDYEGHPEEWSRRIGSLDPGVHTSDMVRHLKPSGAIHRASGEITSTCDLHESSYVVVDSAVMACGTDPLKPEAAAEYADAILAIARPALTLAHVTKADDARYPFGSVFWHNLARTTWGLQADQSGAVVLSHRKHNNYASLGRFQMVATWTDGRLREVYEKGYGQALRERLTEILAAGAMPVSEIVDMLNGDEYGVPVKRNSVLHALRRGIDDRTFTVTGDRWSLS